MISNQIINWDKKNSFYLVTKDELQKVERELGISFPIELRDFYLKVGYGFFDGTEYNINRLMDPFSVRDFRLRRGEYELYPEIELYNHFEDNKLIFFESDTSALISIELGQKEKSKIYYYNTIIADSLEEFIQRIQEDDSYFVDLQ